MNIKEEKFRLLVECLTGLNKTVATMESCTGGGLANEITSVIGSSEVFKYGFVTYSDEAKMDLGVRVETIDKYSVYSKEVASEMAKCATVKSNSNYGIGITGEFNSGNNITYICIYDKDNDCYYENTLSVSFPKRSDNKTIIINFVVEKLLNIIIKK